LTTIGGISQEGHLHVHEERKGKKKTGIRTKQVGPGEKKRLIQGTPLKRGGDREKKEEKEEKRVFRRE